MNTDQTTAGMIRFNAKEEECTLLKTDSVNTSLQSCDEQIAEIEDDERRQQELSSHWVHVTTSQFHTKTSRLFLLFITDLTRKCFTFLTFALSVQINLCHYLLPTHSVSV